MQDEAAYKAEITNIADYLNTNYKNDQFITLFNTMKANNQL